MSLLRRALLTGGAALLCAAGEGFDGFLAGVRAQARRAGISQATIDRALGGLQPNQKVIALDRRQPEFTLTWEHYRTTRLSDARIAQGRTMYAQNRALLQAVSAAYRVEPGVLMGVWGLETNFGSFQGGFNVVEALATLAWDGRRAGYFTAQLVHALRILDHGDVAFARMSGSYAGAMGQPQFMPDSYQRFAVDFDGDGRRDIWDSRADALGSMANYLAKCGWRSREGWGQRVVLPADFPVSQAGRNTRRSVGEWARIGVRREDRGPLGNPEQPASVLLPGGEAEAGSGQAYLVLANFNVIRRYNPSDFYALTVGMLGDLIVA